MSNGLVFEVLLVQYLLVMMCRLDVATWSCMSDG
jgi:hypothetical protein